MRNTFIYTVKIFAPLLLICACVAGLVSGVNLLTTETINQNLAAEKQKLEQVKLEAITGIYGESKVNVLEDIPESVDEIRSVETAEGMFYCVTVTSYGYNTSEGMEIFVAFGENMRILRVMLLSSKETTGIGTKVGEASYLEGYNGKTGTLILGEDIAKIAGATFSSKGLINGVNTAYSAVIALTGGTEGN